MLTFSDANSKVIASSVSPGPVEAFDLAPNVRSRVETIAVHPLSLVRDDTALLVPVNVAQLHLPGSISQNSYAVRHNGGPAPWWTARTNMLDVESPPSVNEPLVSSPGQLSNVCHESFTVGFSLGCFGFTDMSKWHLNAVCLV